MIFHITGVSAVGLFGSFVLNLPVQGFGRLSWRDRSDRAAYAKHYVQPESFVGS